MHHDEALFGREKSQLSPLPEMATPLLSKFVKR